MFPQQVSWQIQYPGSINPVVSTDVFNLDLFDTPSSLISELHSYGVFVICYFSASTYEDWRLDASRFPREVLGKDLEGMTGDKVARHFEA